jgi:glutathione reductase (NADPH)
VQQFDLIVLGGGSGGLATAQRAAEHGARVALFEPGRLGGTCVNLGCVPKKVMWNAAEVARSLAAAPSYGFDVRLLGHDWEVLKRRRDAYVERLNGIYARNLEHRAVRHVVSKGVLASAREVVDAEGNVYRAPHIVIATGGRPIVPALPGAALGITSDGFFALAAPPRRVAVVGGGYIGVELAGILNALGSRVSLFFRYERVLRRFDELLSDHLMAAMTSAGVALVSNTEVARVRATEGLALETSSGACHEGFDAVLWAVGRSPNTAGLGLERAGVATTADGHVEIDGLQNTAAPGVYAVGDVTGRAELTPVAIAAGRRLAERLFAGRPESKLGLEIVPTVIFSHPPIGTIGLSEAAAKERFPAGGVRAYVAEFVPLWNAVTHEKPKTAMKLVTAGTDERVVGCHVIGPGADEMTQGFAVALTMGARKRDFDATIAIHPTSAEELVTMR